MIRHLIVVFERFLILALLAAVLWQQSDMHRHIHAIGCKIGEQVACQFERGWK